MNYLDSSSVFSEAELVLQRMRQFHRERVETIQKDQSHIRLNDPSRLVIHLIPEEAVRAPKSLAAVELKRAAHSIRPLGERNGGYSEGRFNADGYLLYSGREAVRHYSQLYRSGVCEGVMAEAVFRPEKEVKILRENWCEEAILGAMNGYLTAAKYLGLQPPIWMFAALVGCEGARIRVNREWSELSENAIDRTVVSLPESKVDSFGIDPAKHLHSMLDVLWNAAGVEKSLSYDAQGNRNPRG